MKKLKYESSWRHSRQFLTLKIINRGIRLKNNNLFSGLLAKILTKWSPCGIQGMEIHLGAYIYQKYPYVYPLNFQICNTAARVWWTCPYNNNLIKHYTWKRRKCNANPFNANPFFPMAKMCHRDMILLLDMSANRFFTLANFFLICLYCLFSLLFVANRSISVPLCSLR